MPFHWTLEEVGERTTLESSFWRERSELRKNKKNENRSKQLKVVRLALLLMSSLEMRHPTTHNVVIASSHRQYEVEG